LWHLKNGVLQPLKPKVWLILIGTNDLYDLKCIDRFVVANILNVVKMIFDQQPDAQFILHGILPRKDKEFSKTQFLGQVWKRAQAVNLQLRKFCEYKTNMHYMQAGPLFMEDTDVRGRRQIDTTKMSDGIHPTKDGLEVWGDYIVKEVQQILQSGKESKAEDEDVG
jgi:lysophospholipase L1-like esterase